MSWRTKSNLDWLRALPGVSQDEPPATRTSFGIGGPAEFFVESGRVEAIERTIAGCVERDVPYLLLGAGTNLLIADAGIEGLVIRVVEATVHIQRGDGEEAKRMMAKLTAERNETQPIKTKNCGSVFKNPPGDSAGRLVQAAGLKGLRHGAAVVSTLHGNFIVNEGGAKAKDAAALIEHVRAEVKRRFNVELETEVELVGRWK